MAKNAVRNSSSSKLRFIMLEADLADGDFSQITQAITNALKPPAVQQRALIASGGPVSKTQAEPEADEVEVDEGAEEILERPTSNGSRSKTPRAYKMPERLDLDIGEFGDFAKAKNPPDEGTKRHLVAVVWFKEHFNTPSVGINEAYSAYMTAGWSTKMQDFDKPFRMLKKQGLVKRVEPGKYAATFAGLNEVKEMGKPVAADAST